jgi:hypothetical protein
VEDVKEWVKQIGFPQYADSFAESRVDGDLLLMVSPFDYALCVKPVHLLKFCNFVLWHFKYLHFVSAMTFFPP